MQKNKFSKILMLFLALFMVFSTTTPIHAENNAKNMVISDHLIDYSSKRLIVSIDKDKITNQDLIIGEYHLEGDAHPTFLIQYETEKETKKEYIKYKEIADFVDVDFIISSAEGEASNDTELTEDNNAFTELNNLTENLSVEPQTVNGEKVLALIDTGVGTSDSYDTTHVVERSTVLSSSSNTVGWDDNGHGEAMRVNMVAVNPDVRILSVKVLDGKGNGRLSDVYAGIVYAVEYNADVISLSLAAKSTASNTNIQTLQNAINRAHEKGIHVYAAAGNYNAPAENYFPCANEHVVCIGSANEDGTKRSSSNYGDPVAFNTIAGSTSAATAKTASVVLARGPEYPFENLNSGLFYDRDFTLENPFTSPDVQIYFDSDNPIALDMAEAVDFNIDFNENDVIITARIDTSKIKNYSPDKKYLLGDIISIEGDYESYGITSSGENYTVYTIKNVTSDLELLLDCQAIAKEMVVCADGSSANSEAECPVVKYDVIIEGGEAQLSQAEPGVVVGIYPFEHTGRTFIRWEVIEGDVEFEDNTQPHTSFVMPNSNVKIKAVFQDTTPTACPASNYTPELVDVIIVNPNTGGLNTILDEITIKPVKKEGYTFTEFEVEYESVLPTSSIFMGDIEKEETKISLNCIKLTRITAHYEKDDTPVEEQKYKLILVTDTEESKPLEATAGSKIKITAAPAPEGMEFTGWEIIEGEAVIEDSSAQETYVTMVESDVKIKANYEKVTIPIDDPTEETYTLIIKGLDSEDVREVEVGQEVVASVDLPDESYVIRNWTIDKGQINLIKGSKITDKTITFVMPSEDVTLSAVIYNPAESAVPSFCPPVPAGPIEEKVVNGGPTSRVEDFNYSFIADPAPQGMEFDKWVLDIPGNQWYATSVYEEVISLKLYCAFPNKIEATYKQVQNPDVPEPQPVTHTLTVDDGATTSTYDLAEGEQKTITAVESGLKNFTHWEVSEGTLPSDIDLKQKSITITMPNEDLSLIARFKMVDPCALSYNPIELKNAIETSGNIVSTPEQPLSAASQGIFVFKRVAPTSSDGVEFAFDKWEYEISGEYTVEEVNDTLIVNLECGEISSVTAVYKHKSSEPLEEMHKIKLKNAYVLPEMTQELEVSSLELNREIEIYAPKFIDESGYVSTQGLMQFEKFEVVKGDITLPAPEEFEEGYKTKFTMPYEEVEITAVYKQAEDNPPVVNNKYKVTAVNGVASETDVAPGTEVTITFIPPCTDCSYVFNGWESEDIEIENPTQETITFIMPEKDVTIVGDISLMLPPALRYLVNLEVINGTIEGAENNKIESHVYIEGDEKEIPTFVIKANEPKATGCSFAWKVLEGDESLVEDLTSPTTSVTLSENIVIMAAYSCIGEPSTEVYELTLISDHFDTKVSEIEEGKELTVSAPDVEKYKFVKWEVLEGEVAEENLTKQEFKFTPEVISNFKLKAIYEEVTSDNPGTEPGDNPGDTPGTTPTPTPTPTNPTSDNSKGACAAHGGVDCSRKDADGSVYCMDGTKDSSVKYENVAKCKTNTVTSSNSNVTAQTTAVNTGLDSSLRLYMTLGALSIITLIGLLVRKNIRKSEI